MTDQGPTHCWDPSCTRYGKPMVPAGEKARDGKVYDRNICTGRTIGNGTRWSVIKILSKRAMRHLNKTLEGSQQLSHVHKAAKLLEQADRAARELPIKKGF